ncbi:MAG: hypothetical protein A3F35_03415 [Candidatus Woykebacteria bacterium RIFCSPHIGHO2_12_FULL_45_10]|uniref:Uncharacterized protein n=1 Tax=Candidatus Woykebacteria bacterium RIFCSPHIGHO2_12_FULL_45_10 TaxID=1802603 RepID=A0A1G1WQS7_9BACT|nr:MAG: hypothetical protein A3F35_03415 [Candidatus Woykebacteria bacterium RIFCSPHIGHO2_12_FULL_45_10]
MIELAVMRLSFRLAYNSLVQIIGRLLGGLVNLLVILIITRQLGKGVWSDYVTITSFVAIFTLIADFGLNSIFVREVSQEPLKREKNFQSLLSLRIGLALVAIFSSLAILSFTPHTTTVKLGIVIAVLAILAQSISYSASAIFQLVLRFDKAVLADIVGNLFLLVFISVASSIKIGIVAVIVLYLLANFVKALLALFFVSSYVKFGLSFDWKYAKRLLALSWAIGLTAVFSQFTANIDKQIVSLATYKASLGQNGHDAVAIYGLSYRIFDFLISFPAFLINSAFPIMLEKVKDNLEGLLNFTKKIFLVLVLSGIVLTGVSYLLAPYVLAWFGKYPESVAPLRILVLGLPVFFVTSIGFSLLIVLKKEKLLPLIYGFAAAFNFAANFYFVPNFGYNAAAWLTWITELLVLLLMMVFIFQFLRKDETY